MKDVAKFPSKSLAKGVCPPVSKWAGSLASSFLQSPSLNETSVKTTSIAFIQVPGTPNLFAFSKRKETFSAPTGLQSPGRSPGTTLKTTNTTHSLFPNTLQSSSGGPTWGPATFLSLSHAKKILIEAVLFLGGNQSQYLNINIIPGLEGEWAGSKGCNIPVVLMGSKGGKVSTLILSPCCKKGKHPGHRLMVKRRWKMLPRFAGNLHQAEEKQGKEEHSIVRSSLEFCHLLCMSGGVITSGHLAL